MVLKKAKKREDAVLLFILRKYILSSIKKSDFLFYYQIWNAINIIQKINTIS